MKRMFNYVIPIWLAMIVNSLLGITDFIFLSSISVDYLTVVGVAYIPFALISSLVIGLGIESNRNQANNSNFNFWYTVIFGVILATILVIVSQLFARSFLFFAWESPLFSDIQLYFKIISFSIIPTSVLFICTGVLRGNGLPKRTLVFSIMAVVFNIILNYLFISLNLLGDPLLGCAVATVIADTIVALVYILYFIKIKMVKTEEMDILSFIRNALTNSIEKFLSSTTLKLISSIFIVKLSISSANVYFALERYFMPLLLFSHGYFEWIIYSYSKGIKNKGGIYPFYFLVLLIYGIVILLTLEMNLTSLHYMIIYVLFLISSLYERTVIAKYFAEEIGKIVNYVVLVKSILFLIYLFFITYINELSLLTFGYSNLLFTLVEIFVLKGILQSRRKRGFHSTYEEKETN